MIIADPKSYPAMRDSGVSWLGAVPGHWGGTWKMALKDGVRISMDGKGRWPGDRNEKWSEKTGQFFFADLSVLSRTHASYVCAQTLRGFPIPIRDAARSFVKGIISNSNQAAIFYRSE